MTAREYQQRIDHALDFINGARDLEAARLKRNEARRAWAKTPAGRAYVRRRNELVKGSVNAGPRTRTK